MRLHRARLSAVVILGLIASLVVPVSLAGQSQTARDVEAAKEAERKLILSVAEGLKKRDAAMALPTDVKNWKPERTPWGDPDLAGVYSNSDESGIPFERPAQFAGRNLKDITPAELQKLQSAAARRGDRSRGQRCRGSRRPPAVVLVGEPEREQQPRVARASIRRTDAFRRRHPRRRSAPRPDRRHASAAAVVRPMVPRTAASTTGASRAACPAR